MNASAANVIAISQPLTNIQRIAGDALDLQKQINELDNLLEPLKGTLRGYADGNTETIEVPRKGKVLIKKPGEAKTEPTVIFDHVKFLTMPKAVQEGLLRQGVVSYGEKETKASKAAVTITPNI